MTYLVHDKFKDVFFEVQGYDADLELVCGRWWNLGFTGNPWLLALHPQAIRIQNWDVWKKFDPSQPHTHPGRQNV